MGREETQAETELVIDVLRDCSFTHFSCSLGFFLGGGECTAHVGCEYCVVGMNVCVCARARDV